MEIAASYGASISRQSRRASREPLDRLGGVVAEQRDEAGGVRRGGPDRRRPELLGDHLELRRVGLRGGEIAEHLRDLGLRGEQPGPRELVPRESLRGCP